MIIIPKNVNEKRETESDEKGIKPYEFPFLESGQRVDMHSEGVFHIEKGMDGWVVMPKEYEN